MLRSTLVITVAAACPGTLAVVLFHLHYLQGFRVDPGIEGASLGISAANFIATVIDLQPLDLPALCGCPIPQSLARLPTIHRRIAIVTGPRGHGGEAQRQNQQAMKQRWGVFHGGFL